MSDNVLTARKNHTQALAGTQPPLQVGFTPRVRWPERAQELYHVNLRA